MDGSYLFDPRVIRAARAFVCVRLLTYENKAEGAWMATKTSGLANTLMMLLAPDFETKLTGAGRSPRQIFEDNAGFGGSLDSLLAAMSSAAKRYPGNGAEGHGALPHIDGVHRALNVAASDAQPLVVVAIADAKRRAAVEQQLAALAWSDDYRGRFVYTRGSGDALAKIAGAPEGDAVFVAQPGRFGLDGRKLLAANSLDADGLETMLLSACLLPQPAARDLREHKRAARRKGLEWKVEHTAQRRVRGRARR